MQFSYLAHRYLRKFHDKKNYVVQNKFVVFITMVNFIAIILLVTGNLTLNGLKLTGPIKSTAPHRHCQYDNSFVTKGEKIDRVYGPNKGSSLEACNVRATGGAIVGTYFINEGITYQGGPISWGHAEYKLDEDGDSTHPWGMFNFIEAGVTINPINGGLQIMGSFIDSSGLTGISDKEIEKIKNEVIKDITGLVVCGKEKQ